MLVEVPSHAPAGALFVHALARCTASAGARALRILKATLRRRYLHRSRRPTRTLMRSYAPTFGALPSGLSNPSSARTAGATTRWRASVIPQAIDTKRHSVANRAEMSPTASASVDELSTPPTCQRPVSRFSAAQVAFTRSSRPVRIMLHQYSRASNQGWRLLRRVQLHQNRRGAPGAGDAAAATTAPMAAAEASCTRPRTIERLGGARTAAACSISRVPHTKCQSTL